MNHRTHTTHEKKRTSIIGHVSRAEILRGVRKTMPPAPQTHRRATDYTPSVHSRITAGRATSAVAYLAAQSFRP